MARLPALLLLITVLTMTMCSTLEDKDPTEMEEDEQKMPEYYLQAANTEECELQCKNKCDYCLDEQEKNKSKTGKK